MHRWSDVLLKLLLFLAMAALGFTLVRIIG